jgi:hypothetical protein
MEPSLVRVEVERYQREDGALVLTVVLTPTPSDVGRALPLQSMEGAEAERWLQGFARMVLLDYRLRGGELPLHCQACGRGEAAGV